MVYGTERQTALLTLSDAAPGIKKPSTLRCASANGGSSSGDGSICTFCEESKCGSPNLPAPIWTVPVGVKLGFVEPYPINRFVPRELTSCRVSPPCHRPLSAVTSGGRLGIVPVASFAQKCGDTMTRSPTENFVVTRSLLVLSNIALTQYAGQTADRSHACVPWVRIVRLKIGVSRGFCAVDSVSPVGFFVRPGVFWSPLRRRS
jgi:hypothetical protein